MPYAIDADTLAAIEGGRIIDAYMILADLGPDGLQGWWGGVGPMNYDGVDYVGAGRLISLGDQVDVTDGAAVPLVIQLSSIPNSDLTPDVLGTVEDYDYHQRPVVVMTAYFAADTNTLLSVETEYRGYIDTIDHLDIEGGQMALVVNLESRARDALETGYGLRSDEDQRTVDALDGGLRHTISTSVTTILWGRTEQTEGTQDRGGLFARMRARREARRARRAARMSS